MYPAFSLVLFTTLSGAGFGTLVWAGGLMGSAEAGALLPALLAGLVLASLGLMASVFHLKSPMRARFAFSQWRTSWLSREGVLAALSCFAAAASAAMLVFAGASWLPLGLLLFVLCLATVYATAMIYETIRAVPAWATPRTRASFAAFALAGGSLVGAASGLVPPGGTGAVVALLLLMVAWTVKGLWWRRLDRLAPTATVGSATGLGDLGDVRLFERPHVTENWLTHEMGFRVARRHARTLRMAAVLLGGAAPAAIMALTLLDLPPGIAWAALAFHLAGVMIERWLFFAEARHTVTLYYGERAV